MRRTLIEPDIHLIPAVFRPLLRSAPVYDSSCSQEARVLFIDNGEGYFLKSAPKGTLEAEAKMAAYFHQKGLGAQVLAFESDERDWLLTARVPGEDCTHADVLAQPERLADLLGERLRMLHELDFADCPVPDRMAGYKALAAENYRTGHYDKTQFPDSFG